MSRLTLVALVAISALLFLGMLSPAAAPVTLTSPESGSMQPTAPEHSLVLVVDKSPSTGDIGLFQAPEQSQPVLHRLVGTTEDGTAFISQGDANTATDQEVGDPPVERSEVYGVVPTVAGQPVIIPFLGAVLRNPITVVGLWAVLGLSLLYTTKPGTVVRGMVVSIPLARYAVAIGLVVTILLPVAILATPSVIQVELVTSTTPPDEAPHIAEPGEIAQQEVTATSQLGPIVHMTPHASGDVQIASVDSGGDRSMQTATVVHEPTGEPTLHEGSVTVYSYPAVLPYSVVQWLASVSPVLAAFVTSVLVASPFYLLAIATDRKRIPRATYQTLYETRRNTHMEEQ